MSNRSRRPGSRAERGCRGLAAQGPPPHRAAEKKPLPNRHSQKTPPDGSPSPSTSRVPQGRRKPSVGQGAAQQAPLRGCVSSPTLPHRAAENKPRPTKAPPPDGEQRNRKCLAPFPRLDPRAPAPAASPIENQQRGVGEGAAQPPPLRARVSSPTDLRLHLRRDERTSATESELPSRSRTHQPQQQQQLRPPSQPTAAEKPRRGGWPAGASLARVYSMVPGLLRHARAFNGQEQREAEASEACKMCEKQPETCETA
ncbi:uncharacterized protein LOC143841969 [Paroedura picta]|uniref:uncharacterized protein LOC143841969 n=1 Tax=Paroedura picta TaxID=143630 RepID=UPI004055EEAE